MTVEELEQGISNPGELLRRERERVGFTAEEVAAHLHLSKTTLGYLERDGCYLLLHRIKKEQDMNKDKWISVALDGSADDEQIKMLLDMSYELTAVKIKRRHKEE